MNCKQARSNIALCIGNDLDVAAKRELKEHLSACFPCRGYWREMKSSLKILQDPNSATIDCAHQSVWPGVSARLPRRAPNGHQSRFNGWAAAASVAAACCVLIAYAATYEPPLPIEPFSVHSSNMLFPGIEDDQPDSERAKQPDRRERLLFPEKYDPLLPVGTKQGRDRKTGR